MKTGSRKLMWGFNERKKKRNLKNSGAGIPLRLQFSIKVKPELKKKVFRLCHLWAL